MIKTAADRKGRKWCLEKQERSDCRSIYPTARMLIRNNWTFKEWVKVCQKTIDVFLTV